MNEELRNRKYELGSSVVDNESSVVEPVARLRAERSVATTERKQEARHSEPYGATQRSLASHDSESPVKIVRLGDVISKAAVERNGKQNYPVLSMTMRDGLILQKNRFSKQIASIDQSNYLVVKRNQLVESFPIDEGVLDINRICEKGIVSPAYKLWDIDENIILPEFLVLFLKSEKSISFYKQKLRGTTARRRSITDEDFLGMEIPLYKKEKQNEIVELSKKAKLLINQNKKLLELHETLIKSQFVKMFGDNPIENGQWKIDNLGNLCTVTSSKRIYAEEQSFSGIPFLRVSDLVSRINGIIKNDLFIPNETFYELKRLKLVPQKDDILVTSRGTLGLCYVIKSNDNFYFQDGMITWLSFGNHDKIISTFLDYLFRIVIKPEIDRESNGSTIKYISISNIKTLKIPVPPLALQEKFASFVLQVEKSKSAVQKSLEKAETLYKALMQKYFG